jgi:serine protein kinase
MEEKVKVSPEIIEDTNQSIKKRAKREIIPFGRFLELIESGEIKYFPTIHQRLYYTIVSRGVRYISNKDRLGLSYGVSKNKLMPVYLAFEDFVGIADVIDKIVSYFGASLLFPGTAEEELQALVLIGPTGAGKSRFVDRLISLLESSGPMWRLYGCPHNDYPLALLPRHLRPLEDDEKEEKALENLPDSVVNIRRILKKRGITRINYDLCPVCRFRLLKGWSDVNIDGEPLPWAPNGFPDGSSIPIEDYPVEKVSYSKRSNIGYGEAPLTDQDEIDPSPLIGVVDLSKLAYYKSEADPRFLSLIGVFNTGNNGIVEFPEIFKRSRESLKILIGATQDKAVPLPGAFGHTSFNGVIVGHSNWEEFKKFRAPAARNEAVMRRLFIVFFRHNLILSEEVRLLESRVGVKNEKFLFDLAPHTLEMMAALAVMSRYGNSADISPLLKLKVLNGSSELDKNGKEIRVSDVFLPQDGLQETAITVREEMKYLSQLFHRKRIEGRLLDQRLHQKIPVTPPDVIEILPEMIEDVCNAQGFNQEIKDCWLRLVDLVRSYYHSILMDEFRKIVVPNSTEIANNLFRRYVENLMLWWDKQKKDESPDPDEDFLAYVEKNIFGGVKNVSEFRKLKVEMWMREQKTDYRSLGFDLQRAFENCAFLEAINTLHLRIREEKEDDPFYQRVLSSLKDLGYSNNTAKIVLRYFALRVVRKS